MCLIQFQIAIFLELGSCINTLDQPFTFDHWFYACTSPLYFSKASKHGDFTFISSKFSTQKGVSRMPMP